MVNLEINVWTHPKGEFGCVVYMYGIQAIPLMMEIAHYLETLFPDCLNIFL